MEEVFTSRNLHSANMSDRLRDYQLSNWCEAKNVYVAVDYLSRKCLHRL